MHSQPIGTIRVKRRKVIRSTPSESEFRQWREIKVSHHGQKWERWIQFSRYLWKRETGSEVPRGYRIYFRDGNPLNDAISNLVMARENRFAILIEANKAFEKTRRNKQRAAVRRANKRRHIELGGVQSALMNTAAFYMVLIDLHLVFWVPFDSAGAAKRKCTAEFMLEALRRDGIFQVGEFEVLSGAEIQRQMQPDGFLEDFRRYIPDTRPDPKPRATKNTTDAIMELMLAPDAVSEFSAC